MAPKPASDKRQQIESEIRARYGEDPCIKCGGSGHQALACTVAGKGERKDAVFYAFNRNERNFANGVLKTINSELDGVVKGEKSTATAVHDGGQTDSGAAMPTGNSTRAQQESTPIWMAVEEPKLSDEAKSKAEEAIEKKRREMQQPIEEIQADYPPRDPNDRCPKTKTVTANHYKIEINKDAKFYQYEIIGLPPGNREKARSLVEKLIEKVPFLRNSKDHFATDYLTKIISWKNLYQHDTTNPQASGEDGITCKIQDGKSRDGVEPTRDVLIKFSGELDFQKIQRYAQGDISGDLKMWNSSTEIKALNIIISKCFDSGSGFQLGPNKFFIKDTKAMLGGSLYTRGGYFFTVKPAMDGVLLNVSFVTSAFFTSQLVSEFLNDTTTFSDPIKRREALRGARVLIEYGRGKTPADQDADFAYKDGRIKTIEHVSDSSISNQTFEKENADGTKTKTSVKKYLEDTYKHSFPVDTKNLLAINLGSLSEKTWYSPTHLRIIGHQLYRHAVPDCFTETMLERACKSPANNKNWVETKLLPRVLRINDPRGADKVQLKDCSALQIWPRLLEVPAHTMAYPPIKYRDKQVELADSSNWNLARRQFWSNMPNSTDKLSKKPALFTPGVKLQSAVAQSSGGLPKDGAHCTLIMAPDLILNDPEDGNHTEKRYTDMIRKFLGEYRIGNTSDSSKEVFVRSTYLKALTKEELREKLRTAKEWNSDRRKKIVFLLLRKRDIPMYQYFKDIADRDCGLHSICLTEEANLDTQQDKSTGEINSTNLKEDLKQYFGNIMMKANLKFGGINHTTEKVQSVLQDTLVLGADVTHPGTSAITGCPSIAAIVGSVEENGGRFLGSMRLQVKEKRDREIIDEVESMVEERLLDWYKENKKMPGKIIYYRDGVSEGQYAKVKRDELAGIHSAYNKIDAKVPDNARSVGGLQLTAVVVMKRHHTRFYPVKSEDHDGNHKNCKPGTLIDASVTSPYFTDFFLQSHRAIQGTAKPAHYFVLENQIGLKATELQELTHELCYTYVRATMGVSYASPAYYADRLCERGRAYLRDYLTGEPTLRKSLNEEKAKWEQELRKLRTAMYPKQRDEKGRITTPKSKDEEILELVHRGQIAALCRRHTMTKALEVWEKAQGKNKSPWQKSLGDTMFWM